MRKKLSTTAYATLLTAGLVLASPVAASANTTSGSGGVGSGNQVSVPVDIEAQICGNSVAALGVSKAKCKEVAKYLYQSSGKGGGNQTDGSGGIASGNQISIPVTAAVGVCGNSVAVAGVSKADCTKVVKGIAASDQNSGGNQTSGSGGIASGNQISIPVNVAIDVCGNSVAVGGVSEASCKKVVKGVADSDQNKGGGNQTDGSGGVGSGNQVTVPVDAAAEICGNSVSALGVSKAECVKKISDGGKGGGDNGGDGGKGDDGGKGGDDGGKDGGKDDGADKGGDDGGKDGGKDDGKDDGADKGKDSGAEGADDKGKDAADGAESGDEKVDLVADNKSASGGLPVTGAALTGLVAAGLAALGGGAAAMKFSRKRKAAAGTDAEV
ncbi:chaplin family protein [Nocardiopsis mwathae]